MPIIDLAPLDSEGIRRDRPGHQTKWGKLVNVAFRNGALVPRPGFKEYLNWTNEVFTDAAVEPAPAKGLAEVYNPGSATGRAGFGWSQETIRPDGSATITGTWSFSTSSLHADVDEANPSGADFDSSSDQGAQFYLTFANPSGSWTNILGVMLRVRARSLVANADSQATCTIYQRDSSTGALTEVAEFTTYAYDSGESAFWYDYAFLLEKDYVSDGRWTDTNIDNLQVAFEFTDGSQTSTYGFLPNSIVASSGFTDAEDGGAAAVGDITLTKATGVATDADGGSPTNWADDLDTGNGLVATASGSTLQIDFEHFPSSTSLTSVSNVQLQMFTSPDQYGAVEYELYYGSTSGTLIGSGTVIGNGTIYDQPLVVNMSTEPGTGSAWTLAKIEAATWTLKTTTAGTLTVRGAILSADTVISGATLQIDTVSAEIIGDNGGTTPRRLILSNRSFIEDADDGSLNDVTNSVASDDAPSVVPFDWATLYGQVYVVDGIDATKRYPNGSTVFESLTTNNADGATKITGRTVESFADRILYGWVTDNTTVTPERVAYSRQFNGGTHNHVSAGDFDIVDSPGGVVALKTLNESLCFCGKETGIYALRRTGNSRAPIIVDPIDYETRCISMASVKRVLLANQPVIMFLGWSPAASYNVFAFDGSTLTPVGNAISKFLLEAANSRMLPQAIAGVDSVTGTYVLFVAHGQSLDRKFGYAMNLTSGSWTQWQLPYGIYSSDQWNAVPSTANGTAVNSVGFFGHTTMVLGGQNNLPLQAHLLPYDSLTGPQDTGAGQEIGPGFTTDEDQIPAQRNMFTSVIETGDIQLLQGNEVQIHSVRLHLDYRDHGPVRLGVATSTDGGASWTDDTILNIGTLNKTGERRHKFLDLDDDKLVHDRSVRFRIRTVPLDATWSLPYYWEFDRIFIEYTPGGIDGA